MAIKFGTDFPQGTDVTTTLASSGGLLINIDSATGDIAQTASGWIEDQKFDFYGVEFVTSTSIKFDSTVTRTGRLTLALELLDVTGRARCLNIPANNYSTVTTNLANSARLKPLKPNTAYIFSCWAKLNLSSGTGPSASIDFQQLDSGGNGVGSISSIGTTSTDWTLIRRVFTSNASATHLGFLFNTGGAGGIGKASYDINSMKLEEVVEPVANSLTSSSPSLVSFTAVGSTDNIDQSFTTAPNSSSGIGNVGGLQTRVSQSFTATKSKLTGVYLYKVASTGTPTGNLKIDVQTDSAGSPSGTILSTYTIPLATYNALSANAEYLVNLPCNLTSGTKYHIVATNTATEASNNYFRWGRLNAGGYTGGDARYSQDGGAWVVNGTVDQYFKTLYYKPTTNFKASQNNQTVSISADEDGFLDGSTINLTTGTFSVPDLIKTKWDGTSTGYTYTGKDVNKFLAYHSANNVSWESGTSYNIVAPKSSTEGSGYVVRIKLPIDITNLNISYAGSSTVGTSIVRYSYDLSSWTTLGTSVHETEFNTTYTQYKSYSFTPTGNTVYIEFGLISGGPRIGSIVISGNIDTSSLPILYNYPTNKSFIRQYTKSLGSPTTTATYRATKWGFPAIEYGSDTNIDQSQLTNTGTISLRDTAPYQAQQFTPTQSRLTGFILYKSSNIGSPTGAVTFSIVNDSTDNPGTTTYATYTYSNASWLALTNSAEFTVPLPCNLVAGTKYWLKMSYSVSSATDYPRLGAVSPSVYTGGIYKYGTDGITYGVTYNGDIYFKTLYSTVEYQYLDIDTTATGSTVAFSEDGASYTTVADGASLAIASTSTPSIFVKHNITANRIYLSSNDYNASSNKDGSLKQSVTYQVKHLTGPTLKYNIGRASNLISYGN